MLGLDWKSGAGNLKRWLSGVCVYVCVWGCVGCVCVWVWGVCGCGCGGCVGVGGGWGGVLALVQYAPPHNCTRPFLVLFQPGRWAGGEVGT